MGFGGEGRLACNWESGSIEAEKMMQGGGQDAGAMKEMEQIMKDYHDLVESGRREVYKIEG